MSVGHLCEAEAPTEPTGDKTPPPPSADGGTLYGVRSARVEFENSPVDCFQRRDTLQERVSL